jgi:hypothetical protein
VCTHEIIERKSALSELLKSESQFRAFVDGVGDSALYMLDPA